MRRSLGVVAFALGILTVSRLDYARVVNRYVRREHPPMHLVLLVILVAIGLFSPQILLAVVAHVLSGIVARLARLRPGRRPARPRHEQREPVDVP